MKGRKIKNILSEDIFERTFSPVFLTLNLTSHSQQQLLTKDISYEGHFQKDILSEGHFSKDKIRRTFCAEDEKSGTFRKGHFTEDILDCYRKIFQKAVLQDESEVSYTD